MTLWIPYVFVRFLLFFIVGILAGIYLSDLLSLQAGYISLGILTTLFGLMVVLRKQSRKVDPGWVAFLFLLLTGFLNVKLKTEAHYSDHIIHLSDSISFYQGVIVSYPEEKQRSWKSILRIKSVKVNNEWKPASGRVALYFGKNDFETPRLYGDELIIRGSPPPIQPPANPHEFNYKRFLSFQQIHFQHFIREGEMIYVRHHPPNRFINTMMKARARSLSLLKQHISGEKELAIASALVLGLKDGLDNELTQAYAAAGAMHVLAVSGLHVGIIYGIILILLRPLKRSVSGRWMVAIISILSLWCYAFITGLSPSVMRAATMFSFMALAVPGQQRTNIYNTLAVSAFCLLLYNPYFIMAVGFQLSYMAVLGIVYLYPRLTRLWMPSSWLMSRIWQITCVSIAAQLATFPIGLLYFHQFPVYFMISNLFVIPLAFTILVVGLVIIFTGFFEPVAQAVGWLETWLIRALNSGVEVTESMPFSIVTDVHITTFECWVLLIFIVLCLVFFELRKFQWVYPVLAGAILYASIQWYYEVKQQNSRRLIVYHIRGHRAMDLMERGVAFFFADTLLQKDKDRVRFHLSGNRITHGVRVLTDGSAQPFSRSLPSGRILHWHELTILTIEDRAFNFSVPFPVDYLVVSYNSIRDLNSLKNQVNFRYLIIDSSYSKSLADKLLHQARQEGLSVYSVLHDGAFELEI